MKKPPDRASVAQIARITCMRALCLLVSSVCFVLCAVTVPHRIARSKAHDWYVGGASPRALAERVVRDRETVSGQTFATGADRFDGEWVFGTHLMAALGLHQLAAAGTQPKRLRREADSSLRQALDADGFDAAAWGERPLKSLDGPNGHAAYLGYVNLALSLRRASGEQPDDLTLLNDRISFALDRRLARTPGNLLETYPGEVYPVDNVAVVASLALRDQRLGTRDHQHQVARFYRHFDTQLIDAQTGLLHQTFHRGNPGPPRGSGSALAVYFLSHVSPHRAARLGSAIRKTLYGTVAGFGVISEYAPGQPGRGDIDSGPLVFGYSISASGFSIATCRLLADRECFDGLWATLEVLGAPRSRGAEIGFVSGGPLANAIMLAMLTAPTPLRAKTEVAR